MLRKIYLGSTGETTTPSMVESGDAPTTGGTLTPSGSDPLQLMTTGTVGDGDVSITLDTPSGTITTGTKLEIWITANANTSLDISAYTIPSGSTLVSPVSLVVGKTYIFLMKKGFDTDWYLVSFVGGY